tara:strand:- start:33 stop:314 length:282 start_codon:yes stop_codon:yes gene_type:complete
MSKSLDRVLQPDGSYKWEEVDLIHSTKKVEPVIKTKSEEVVITKEPVVEKTTDFENMTKKQLESFGRTIGIELDKRHTKAALIAELKKFTSPE